MILVKVISDDSGRSDCESDAAPGRVLTQVPGPSNKSVLAESTLDTPSPVPVKKAKKMTKTKKSSKKTSKKAPREEISDKTKKQGMNSRDEAAELNANKLDEAVKTHEKPKKKQSVKRLAVLEVAENVTPNREFYD